MKLVNTHIVIQETDDTLDTIRKDRQVSFFERNIRVPMLKREGTLTQKRDYISKMLKNQG